MNEPKLKQSYTLICDNCRGIFYSSEAFPSPQICPICRDPDLGGLLTAKELKQSWLEAEQSMGFLKNQTIDDLDEETYDEEARIHGWFVAKARRDLTASILKGKCQERVEGIVREIECFMYSVDKTKKRWEFPKKKAFDLFWQALKKQEGIDDKPKVTL